MTDAAASPVSSAHSQQDDYEDIDLTAIESSEELVKFNVEFDLWARTKEKPFIRQRDKIAFFLGVVNFGVLAYFTGGNQYVLPWIFTVKYPFLVFFRFYTYKKNAWHYFLLDFCYYANLLLLVYLWILPDDSRFFVVVFCVTHGPLAWAVVLFRNSLVFHSIDKITSCFIHISPMIVTFAARWHLNPSSKFELNTCEGYDGKDGAQYNPENCPTNWTDTLAYPMLFFVAHQALYYLLVHVILRSKIDKNSSSLTTYKYLVKSSRKSPVFKFVSICGAPYRRLVFSFWYCVFAAVTILPTVLMYKYYWINLTFGALVIMRAIWNGANFYIDVFSRKYEGVQKAADGSNA